MADDQVYFNGKLAAIEQASPTEIFADVPLAAGTGNVTITVSGANASGPIFTYQPALVVTTFAGSLYQGGSANGTAESARFNQLSGLAIDKNGNLYTADEGNSVIRKITPQGVVTTFAGSGKQGRTDGTTATATFEDPTGVAVDQQGNVFVADGGLLRKVTPGGNVSTIVTHLNVGNILLGGPLSTRGIAVDAADNLYVTDESNQFIGKIAPDGTVTAIAGTTQSSYSSFTSPNSVVLDKSGNLYIPDGIIWKITLPNTVSKFAIGGTNGQNFSGPQGISIDSQGNLYVADTGNLAIKKIAADGTVSTIAGNTGIAVITNGIVSKASFGFPVGTAVDASGNIFVTDVNSIREISFQ